MVELWMNTNDAHAHVLSYRKTVIKFLDNHMIRNLGGLAQLVERVLSMHEVVSSILTFSIFCAALVQD